MARAGAGKRSVFEQAITDRKTLAIKIDPTLHADLEALEARLEKMGVKLAFNRARIIESALREAIDDGNAELDRLAATA